MKRTVIVSLLVSMLATAVPVFAQDITLTWWINPWRIRTPDMAADATPTGEEYAQYISDQFMALHPDIKVEYEMVPNQGFAEKVTTAIFAGNPPDVLKDLAWNPDWAREGLLAPIDDHLTAEDEADFLPYALAKGEVDGQHYLWPWNNSNNGMGSSLLLNTALFEEAGVALPALPTRDWTLDQFLADAQKLTVDKDGDGRTDVYAITLAAQDTDNMLAWLYRFGAHMLNDDATAFTLNSPEGVKGLQFMVDLIYEYGVAPEGAEALGVYDTIDNLHQGRAAMGYGGIYEIGRIDRYINEGKLENPVHVVIAPFPNDPATGPVAQEISGGFMVFKQRDAAQQEAAMELAQFITNPENTAMLESLLYLTARKSVNATLTFENVQAYTDDIQEQVQTYQNAISHGIPYWGPSSLDVDPAVEYFTAAMQAALSRQKTPQQALDDFVRDANRVVFGN